MKKMVIIICVVIMGCIVSVDLSYAETGQNGQSPSMKSDTGDRSVSEHVVIPSDKTDAWLFAHDYRTSTEKKGGFNLFGKPQTVIDYKDQTKEWEARTLRSLGLAEFFGGIGLAITGIAILDDSAPGGLASIVVGIGAAYIGYKDLKASNRFFYPHSLYSQKDMPEDHMYPDKRNQTKKDFSIRMNLASHTF